MAVGLPAERSVEETKRRIQLGSVGMQEVVWGNETLESDGSRQQGKEPN